MKPQESINNYNQELRDMQSELETLTLQDVHAGGCYNHATGYRIAYLRAQMHVVTLKRNAEIKQLYSKFVNGSEKD
ncbi:unnamed protein product [Adineta steineri]|uniref:Uncharacterized protein n=4 Tax=Adineta steineri TaxID=433720 RepID=A0A819HA13_9BILA|nr:unnamed protein product [Adineta steineri]CAF0984889.1 unnamed protein product [Adineta steineri]CAF1003519.1 unnamed protein product [Adineta steineri]CAF1085356.1 unnamed protein product [Adineta steineri]CAF1175213.1 unnamed protein product [Adineta steineri]